MPGVRLLFSQTVHWVYQSWKNVANGELHNVIDCWDAVCHPI